jgi:hypothetical protein
MKTGKIILMMMAEQAAQEEHLLTTGMAIVQPCVEATANTG